MKAYLVIEGYHSQNAPMSGYLCSLFYDRKSAENRLGYYKRNQAVRILEVSIVEQSQTGVE